MDVDEVRALVSREIGKRGAERNHHGIRVSERLVDPIRVQMAYLRVEDGAVQQDEAWVWLLLEERADGSGYKIVYDEKHGLFGLATQGHEGVPVIVTCCSRFMDAFVGM